ncbi:GDP-L-galactose phosphorylase 1 [Apostasia shenzhenica]|uniref:GDP-L-galactose phosphorylase 1 n=1 Tax=Apostasia shenzhenica TaxID=1088818 RepID=A0A2I0B2F5_9ASPA|nr:GDP-L-galactose phosphorylase 1 [Apostasia shenzhenica]
MVSVTQLEGDYRYVNQNQSQGQSKCDEAPLKGFETPLYLMCTSLENDGAHDFFACTEDGGQSLLDSLILSQWEERAWKGQFSYDITSCATKIIEGGLKLTAQLNEKWNSKFFTEFEKKAFQPSGGVIKPCYVKANKEDILFCVASGDRERPLLIPLTGAPQDGVLLIVNENPIEYGHIFLVPYLLHKRMQTLGKALQLIIKIAVEVNSSSLRMFCDFSTTNTEQAYFQASYFANPLPVERLATIPVYVSSLTDGMSIWEVADYPLKVLVFTSKNLKKLVEAIAEICSTLQQRNTVFNLLISDCGTRTFLFPQVHLPVTGRHLHAWECGGYFIYNRISDFDSASEMEISKRLASVSLDVKGFQYLKQLSCSVAAKIA